MPTHVNHKFPKDKLQRLSSAVTFHRRQLRTFRDKRTELVRQYVGSHWSDNGTDDKQPLAFLEMAASIYVQALAGGMPQAMVSTINRQMKPSALGFELRLNNLFREIALDNTLQRVVQSALFGIGIIKTGVNRSSEVEIGGFLHDVGQAYAEEVSLDDWVHDTSAKRWEEIQFCGNIYTMPLQDMKDSGLFSGKVLEEMAATERRDLNEDGEEKTAALGREHGDADDYKDVGTLIDLWLPSEGVLLTLPFNMDGGSAVSAPARVVEYQGPERGPYHRLGLADVPDNIMPLPPLAMLQDLHELGNRMFSKMARQALRQKDILATQKGSGEDDAATILDSSDGDIVGLSHPNTAKNFRMGGVSGENFGFFLQSKDMFSYLGGNLDTMGGLSPQSETVGQEKIINTNSNKRLESMARKTIAFTQGVMMDLGFRTWADPISETPIMKRVPGSDLEIPSTFGPKDREGDFYEQNIRIDPYSLQYLTPELKLQKLLNVLNTVIIPLAPALMSQGQILNTKSLLAKVFKLAGIQDVEDIILDMTEEQKQTGQQQGGGDGGAAKPAVTERNYTRRSIPGASRAGKDGALMQSLMGGKLQPNEEAAQSRPVG